MKYRRVYSHHFHTTIAESIHTTPNYIQCPFKHDMLFEILSKAGVPDKEINIIKSLYLQQKATVRYENETSEEITIKRGVRQGCILSPCLFNIYTEYLIREALEDGEGININGQNITNIRYADDTIILAESEQQLQHNYD